MLIAAESLTSCLGAVPLDTTAKAAMDREFYKRDDQRLCLVGA